MPTPEEIKAALIAEHAQTGPYPTEGGVWRRSGETLERVEPASEPEGEEE